VLVSPLQQAILESYGPHGHFLGEHAAAGSTEAAYQAAVLLGCAPDGGQKAMPLLRHAAAAGHAQAQELLAASSDRLDRLDAAAHAYELAEAAADQSCTAIAILWYERAASNGLPVAAMKLAHCHQARGEQELAVRWLAVAAEHGYTRAEITLAELTRSDRFPPPPTGVHRAVGGARTPLN
jgi:TPR repeat protein